MKSFLDKITGVWAKQWVICWFAGGVIITAIILQHTISEEGANIKFELFKSAVVLIGMLCVVSLSFRKNILGNGLGIVANTGEITSQYLSGATGLMLAPIFYMATHIFGLFYWRKGNDTDGDMIPKKANKNVWIITIIFILAGLLLFPYINQLMQENAFIVNYMGNSNIFYSLNILAFVLGVAAQTAMILKYKFSWSLWIVVNFIWLAVNIINQNWIFVGQLLVYQVNAFVGLYEWNKTR